MNGLARHLMDELKQKISEAFNVTHEGELSWVLGMEVKRNRENKTITLSQQKYLMDVLSRFNMTKCKEKETPMDSSELNKAWRSLM